MEYLGLGQVTILVVAVSIATALMAMVVIGLLVFILTLLTNTLVRYGEN